MAWQKLRVEKVHNWPTCDIKPFHPIYLFRKFIALIFQSSNDLTRNLINYVFTTHGQCMDLVTRKLYLFVICFGFVGGSLGIS